MAGALFGKLLPRHLEIVHDINRRFLDRVRQQAGDEDLIRRLSLVDESGSGAIRMAHLASAGSHAINGVAALHSELLKETVLRDFYRVSPEKFRNVTNGVTPRRWIALSNPGLAALLTRTIGERWMSIWSRSSFGSSRSRPTPVPRGLARGEGRQQGSARRPDPPAHGHRRGSAVALRHPGEAAAHGGST